MGDAEWKGYIINALRMAGFSSDMIKKVMKNLEKSINVISKEEAESIYSKHKSS